jgi:hypothetical protein
LTVILNSNLKLGIFNFKSDSHDAGTLLISGAKATYRGIGTVNGYGSYGFMVSAVDGDVSGGGGNDKFRIKIWEKSHCNKVVYDNQMSALENVDATIVIGGGSIVTHEVKTKGNAKVVESLKSIVLGVFDVIAYPNPSNNQFTLAIEGGNNEKVEVKVFDLLSRLVKVINKSDAQPTLFGEDLLAGSYITIINQGIDYKTVRSVKKKLNFKMVVI